MNHFATVSILLASFVVATSVASPASAHADQLCESYDCESATSASTSSGSSGSGSSSTGASNGSSTSSSTTAATTSAPAITVNISTVQTPASASWQNPVAAQSSDDCGTTQSNFAGDPLLGGSTYCSSNNGNTQPTIYNSTTNSFASAAPGKDLTFGQVTTSGASNAASSSSNSSGSTP